MPGTRPVVGRQGFDPDMLLALLLYAYAVGERSSRRIERLRDHVAFLVVCGQDAPDHTTIARFRARHDTRSRTCSRRCCGCARPRGW